MEQNIIKKLIGKALSNSEILKIINNKSNLVSYTNLHKYKSLDELLKNYGACIILYETSKNYGHWVCIFKLDPETIEFFDPYGGNMKPDKELQMINKDYRNSTNQNFPYLTKLMIDSPYVLTYNHHNFQSKKKG